jgi:hypothetical protein
VTTLNLSAAWDLTIDTSGNIALAPTDQGLAQDAASAIKLFLGEYYFDVTQGVPWLQQILGQAPPLALLKQILAEAAETVPGVSSAQVFITSFSDRAITGQVQVLPQGSATPQAANFSVFNPQGGG